MILLVLVFVSNFVFTWIIPIACVCSCACACVASGNQALPRINVLHSIVNNECSRKDECDTSQLEIVKILKTKSKRYNDLVSLFSIRL